MFYGNLSKIKFSWSLSLFLLAFSLLGCSSLNLAKAETENSIPPTLKSATKNENLGQMLPISAKATIGGEQIELEVAKTPREKAIGLMYREFLPANRGMVFNFDPPQFVGFWMKNVSIPLDMVFLRNNRVVAIAANVPPCKSNPCPTYGPQTKIDRVIELPGGRAIELGLQPGDAIEISDLNQN